MRKTLNFVAKPPSTGSALEIKGLTFAYPKQDERILQDLSHEFTPGVLTALTGESGRGKSTLLYILGLMLAPSVGEVWIESTRASALSDSQRSLLRAARIGFVFQDAELDPTRTIVDSVTEPGLYAGGDRTLLRTRAHELLEEFGLEHRAQHRPGQISGGQAQRVAVCRALINSPAIVLADEPTGNLDPENASLVLDALARAAETGCTVVIATHDPNVVARTDEVIRL